MRGKKAPKREVKPDSKYGSPVVQLLINLIMHDGEKTVAEDIVYGAFEKVAESTKKEGFDVFSAALENIQPKVELRSRRVGGANYQVPVPVSKERANALALRWLIAAARARKGEPMQSRLTKEILDAYNKTGEAIMKRENTHKMAEANKAFAIFRW
jgi:small subunit ribosomal protein S7